MARWLVDGRDNYLEKRSAVSNEQPILKILGWRGGAVHPPGKGRYESITHLLLLDVHVFCYLFM